MGIVTHAVRAKDDATAHDLMSSTLKNQLKMDKRFNEHFLSFIVTKCDEVSATETFRSLNLKNDGRYRQLNKQLEKASSNSFGSKRKYGFADESPNAGKRSRVDGRGSMQMQTDVEDNTDCTEDQARRNLNAYCALKRAEVYFRN
ncbi:hypothetical protein EW026_g3607 [Hermanssonia centrifuga]|uniref:Uncharacterized protein n=1 Tax=Hermanssonia centrifuga TaxID=98765 RepID=A0A4S4KK46_9APHY|nr:hypothetical protein EW026_g3607 [Hermanssonia centrifuga]